MRAREANPNKMRSSLALNTRSDERAHLHPRRDLVVRDLELTTTRPVSVPPSSRTPRRVDFWPRLHAWNRSRCAPGIGGPGPDHAGEWKSQSLCYTPCFQTLAGPVANAADAGGANGVASALTEGEIGASVVGAAEELSWICDSSMTMTSELASPHVSHK
jgi:hypothetical protein